MQLVPGTVHWPLEHYTGHWNIGSGSGTHIQSNSMMVVSYGACPCIQDYSSSLVWHMQPVFVT